MNRSKTEPDVRYALILRRAEDLIFEIINGRQPTPAGHHACMLVAQAVLTSAKSLGVTVSQSAPTLLGKILDTLIDEQCCAACERQLRGNNDCT